MIFNENGILYESKLNINSLFINNKTDETNYEESIYQEKDFNKIPKKIFKIIENDCYKLLEDMYDQKIEPYLDTAKISQTDKNPSKSDFVKTSKIFNIRFIKDDPNKNSKKIELSLDIGISNDMYIHWSHVINLELYYDGNLKLVSSRAYIDG